jgi:hypothetical protein
LDCTGRQLREEGCQLVCEALLKVSEAKVFRLEELHLAGNDLTAIDLLHLVPVIRANAEIRDLDLSRNRISVKTIDEKKAWAAFLAAFRDSRFLRRIELSNNPLGDYAIEILLRTYAFEKPIYIPITHTNFAETPDDNYLALVQTNGIDTPVSITPPITPQKGKSGGITKGTNASTNSTLETPGLLYLTGPNVS